MATRDGLMQDIADILGMLVVDKGVGSSVHNDFIDPLAVAVLGDDLAEEFPDKYRKIQAIIELLGGTYAPADPDKYGVGDTSEGTKSGGGGTLTNQGLGKIRDLLLENGVPNLSTELEAPVAVLINEGFDPSEIVASRPKRLAAIATRPGGTGFRNAVRKAYGEACCVTGTNDLAALEAAHIAPYQGPDSDKVGNALLLRADIHKLHDALLLAVSDEDLTVLVKPRLLDTTYADLAGESITPPRGFELSESALKLQRERCGL